MELLKPEELDNKQQKLLDTSIFVVKLLLAGLVFRAILYFEPSTLELQRGLAQLTSTILILLNYEATLEGIRVFIGADTYVITQDCLGWKSIAAFLGLSFASGVLKQKSKLVFLGILALILANIIRIVTTVVLSQNGWVSFDFVHSFMWRWLLTGITLILWISVMKSQQIMKTLTNLERRLIESI